MAENVRFQGEPPALPMSLALARTWFDDRENTSEITDRLVRVSKSLCVHVFPPFGNNSQGIAAEAEDIQGIVSRWKIEGGNHHALHRLADLMYLAFRADLKMRGRREFLFVAACYGYYHLVCTCRCFSSAMSLSRALFENSSNPEDEEDALEWLKFTASSGRAQAIAQYGELLEKHLVANDDEDEEMYSEVFQHLSDASAMGNADALCHFADVLLNGRPGTPIDITRGINCYKQAISKGHVRSLLQGMPYLIAQIPEEEAEEIISSFIGQCKHAQSINLAAETFHLGTSGFPVNLQISKRMYERVLQEDPNDFYALIGLSKVLKKSPGSPMSGLGRSEELFDRAMRLSTRA